MVFFIGQEEGSLFAMKQFCRFDKDGMKVKKALFRLNLDLAEKILMVNGDDPEMIDQHWFLFFSGPKIGIITVHEKTFGDGLVDLFQSQFFAFVEHELVSLFVLIGDDALQDCFGNSILYHTDRF